MRKLSVCWCACLFAAISLEPASGAELMKSTKGGDVEIFGQWRYLYSNQQQFPLNSAGEFGGPRWTLDNRLDLGTRWIINDQLRLEAEIKILDGQVAGELDDVGIALRDDARRTLRGWDPSDVDLRQAYLQWNAPWFMLRVGQQYSRWGLGLVANDGRQPEDRFGFSRYGDMSERLIVATRPLASLEGWLSQVVTAVGGGLVYHDENCSLRAGDRGGEIIGTIFYREEGLEGGMYVAGRIQDDEDGTFIHAAAIDFFASLLPGPDEEGLVAEAEIALLTGTTDRIIQADRTGGLEISALGAVLRGGWQFGPLRLRPVLEIGYASGDADPYDGVVTQFSFDPDYQVGLVLYDVLLRQISAMAAQELADPDRVGQPVSGTDLIPTGGEVSNSIYLMATVGLKPLEQLSLLGGVLVAFSATPFSQNYQSFANGGVPVNLYGKHDPGRYLGSEFDLGADWKQPIWKGIGLLAGVQVGWFLPGSAFDRPEGGRPGVVSRFLGRVALNW